MFLPMMRSIKHWELLFLTSLLQLVRRTPTANLKNQRIQSGNESHILLIIVTCFFPFEFCTHISFLHSEIGKPNWVAFHSWYVYGISFVKFLLYVGAKFDEISWHVMQQNEMKDPIFSYCFIFFSTPVMQYIWLAMELPFPRGTQSTKCYRWLALWFNGLIALCRIVSLVSLSLGLSIFLLPANPTLN
jgi:hypothetical protein